MDNKELGEMTGDALYNTYRKEESPKKAMEKANKLCELNYKHSQFKGILASCKKGVKKAYNKDK